MLAIGQTVIISPDRKQPRPRVANSSNCGKIIDLHWNMAQIRFIDGTVKWIELIRVYDISTS
jgi:hypothetical protein